MTRIAFVGDISLNGAYDELLILRGSGFPFEKIKAKFEDSELVVGNLESPFCSGDLIPAFPMKTPLKADPGYAQGLKWAGFDVLNLSNNHVLDYGEQAVAETQHTLNDHKILHFGYGKDLDEAKRMRIVQVEGMKVGFVGYTDVLIDSPFFAGSSIRGVAGFVIDDAVEDTIRNRQRVDFLVISLHWGIEYFHLPTPDQIDNARKLIDAGADVVIGHHPHVLQGIEKYKRGLIAYSLGNFVFSEVLWEWHTPEGEKRLTKYALKKDNRQTVIFKVDIGNCPEGCQVVGASLNKNGQVDLDPSVNKKVGILSKVLKRNDYDAHFQRELNSFRRRRTLNNHLRRLLRVHKLRPKHFKELYKLVTHAG